MKIPGVPADIGSTVDGFKDTLARIEAQTKVAADAATAALIGEFGTDRAAELLGSARAMRAELASWCPVCKLIDAHEDNCAAADL